MSFSSPSVIDSGSTSLESHLRTRPLVFSTVPFCQGDCADNGCDRFPVAGLLLRVIDFGYFGAGQERRRFSFPHAIAFERYAVSVVNNAVQDRVS